jgi:MFS family permease
VSLDPVTRRRLLVGLAAVARFGSGILMGTGFAVYVDRFGGSPFAVSLLFPAYFIAMTVVAPAWGAVADVTGRRRLVLVITGLGASLAVLPLLLGESVWALVAVRGLYAVFAAGFPPVILAVVSETGGEGGRGRELGFFNSARAAGFTGGQLAVGALIGLLAPVSTYLVIAAVSLVSTLAVALFEDVDAEGSDSVSAREIAAEVRSRLLPAREDRAHLRTAGLRWLYAALALRNMTVMGVFSLMPVFLTGAVGVPEAVMGVLLAVNPASQVVFMYLFGQVADAAGRKPMIAVGMAGSGVFAVVAAFAVTPETLALRAGVAAVGFLIIAAAYSAMSTGALAFIGDVAPAGRESELMGLRSTAKGIGGVLGPPLFGAAATLAGYRSAFLIGSALAFAATGIVVVRLAETRPGTEAAPAVGD